MPTVFFVDTDPGTVEQWQKSGHNSTYTALPFTPFSARAETAKLVTNSRPDIVVLASNLGNTSGMQVVCDLRLLHQVDSRMIINGPLGRINSDSRCTPDELRKELDDSMRTSPLPRRHSQDDQPTPSSEDLPKAVIAPNGWVHCPNKIGEWQCHGERYVAGRAGKTICTICARAFEAVISLPPPPAPTICTARAINTYGDVECPHCGRFYWSKVSAVSQEIMCEKCHNKFTAAPFQKQ